MEERIFVKYLQKPIGGSTEEVIKNNFHDKNSVN